jgi:hypothetical protein
MEQPKKMLPESTEQLDPNSSATSSSVTAAEPTPTTVEAAPKRRKTSFGSVECYEHAAQHSGDRLPHQGPAIGLGALLKVSFRRVESFENARVEEREGVRHLEPEERRQRLAPLHRSESLDAMEQAASLVRRQRLESALEPDESRPSASASADGGREQPTSPLAQPPPPPFAAADLAAANEEEDVGVSDLF